MESAYSSEVVDKVRLAAEIDAAEQPMAINKTDVPWAVEAITATWLDAWLGSGVGQPRIVDVGFSDGSSGSSVRGSITAIREDADDLRLFAKSYPHFENRLINIVSGTALAEGHFYTELRPLLDIETPLGYHASWDLDRYRAIIIIENIASTRGASFCNRNTTISRAEIESALRLLARLHGQFLEKSSLKHQFPWLVPYEQWSDIPMSQENAKAFIEARDVIPTRLHSSAEQAYARYRQLRSGKPEQTTIIHSDVHLGNWYKTQSGSMGLCDWQCLSIGDPMRDISYAMSSLLATEDRRAWENDLLRFYAAEMEEVSGRKIDFESLYLRYRRWIFAALLFWTPTLVPPENFPDMQPKEMSMLQLQRITATIDDLECLSAFD